MKHLDHEDLMYQFEDALFIKLNGKIETKTAETFQQEMLEATKNITHDSVVFDLRKLKGMNSRILGIVVKVWQTIESQKKTIRVIARPHVAELLRLSRLDHIVDLYVLHESADS